MSRIGKLPISIPAGATVTLKDDVVTVEGPTGEMSHYVNLSITVALEEAPYVVIVSMIDMLHHHMQNNDSPWWFM